MIFRVGKPWTPKPPQKALLDSSSQSTAATLARPERDFAAFSYAGCRFLQWPHQGA